MHLFKNSISRQAKIWMISIFLMLPALAKPENLISNGCFESTFSIPEFWTPSSVEGVICNPSGGPGGQQASISFATGKGCNLRQKGLILLAGEKYKFSGYYKTKNFKAADTKVVIHSDDGWISEEGVRSFSANIDWAPFEKIFTAFPSKTGKYGVALSVKNCEGEIQFADLKLEALTEKGLKGSFSVVALVKINRLTPIWPLLNHIPAEKPELTLRCLDKLPAAYTEYDTVCEIPAQKISLDKDGAVTLNLQGLGLGDHQLAVSVIERTNGEKVFESNYPITIVKTPKIDSTNHKVLNNLVTEILNQPVAPELQFSNPRDGWVFISVPAGTTAKLDGKELYLPSERSEAVAFLSAGPHNLDITGKVASAVVVRSIAEILNYPALSNSIVAGNGSYGWDFMKKHVNYALTTLNGGILNPEKQISDEIKKLGFIWLTNNCNGTIRSPEEAARKMLADPGLTDPRFAGFTEDEFGYADITLLDSYSRALRSMNIGGRLIYTWIVGKPTMLLHCDFMSSAINIGHGKSKIIHEVYCLPRTDEKSAQAYLEDRLVDTVRKSNDFYPGINPHLGMVLGNFSQAPINSLDTDPAVDYKYYLDMQLNTIANRAEFKNLGLVGYWGSYYADEEMYRWSFKLMRHYAIEGKKNMLSEEYGFKYNPGFLKNCDFVDGLNNWKASGNITVDPLANCKIPRGRRDPNNPGDTFAMLNRIDAQVDKLSQTAKNLIPGKLYCLKFIVADYSDIKNKIINPRLLGLNAELPGASIIKDKSFVYIDNRNNKKQDFGRINFHRIVFRATAPEQTITFNDEQAMPGQSLILNYVKLTPYFE